MYIVKKNAFKLIFVPLKSIYDISFLLKRFLQIPEGAEEALCESKQKTRDFSRDSSRLKVRGFYDVPLG